MSMSDYMAWPGELEIRQVGGAKRITGKFRYSETAVIADRGQVRKEVIMPNAFEFATDTEPERRIDLLVGHDFGKPIASRQSGTLVISNSAESVDFEAMLPPEELTPSWVTDAEKAIANGTMTGLSPGFRVPPKSAVPGAERLVPERGNTGVQVRQVHAAVLRELSIVTSGSYVDAYLELREETDATAVLWVPRRLFLCL